ncbi:MAG TPA: gamma-glutamylcyclotransferase, partial [Candidatus Coprovivens excrementavium]|nr:gamma-glutamylcyclotransferase [Candidatus Coprovivens excrementavium]
MKEIIYFAYGSNLNIEEMNKRCPSSNILGSTILKDYKLVFKGS